MKLPVSSDYDSILVVCDRFLKMLHFVAMTEKITAEGLANLFKDNVWKLHGLPESVILNRRPQFAAELMKELNKVINGFSSTNRWTNREDKPRAGTVLKNVRQFHLAQFLSNFFKYSSSNLLLFYPNKILAIYFSSNLLVLNSFTSGFNFTSITLCFLFLFSICYTSFSLISFSNSSTKFITFFKFSNSFQVSSFAI